MKEDLGFACLTYDGGPDSKLFPNRRVHLGNALVVASACQSSAAARAHRSSEPTATAYAMGRKGVIRFNSIFFVQSGYEMQLVEIIIFSLLEPTKIGRIL